MFLFRPVPVLRRSASLAALMGLALLEGCGGGGSNPPPASPVVAPPKAWGTAAVIETDNAGSAYNPQVAFDKNGNALAIWAQHMGALTSIWSSRYTAAAGWGVPVLVETNDTGAAGAPQIAIDANGNALAVWDQENGARRNIWANRYTAAGWGVPVLIETDDTGNANEPKVVIDASGNALAVWVQDDGTANRINFNRYTAATNSWGTAGFMDTSATSGSDEPQIAFDANGNAVAVWTQRDSLGRNSVWSNRYAAAGNAWGTPGLIETDDAGDAYSPHITVDSSGNALAVWSQSDSTRVNILAKRYVAASGLWGAVTRISSTGDAYSPRIAFDANGNALAVWVQSEGTRYDVWSNRYTAGTGWGTGALIETDNAGSAGSPRIAFDANGNALAVWTQSDGTRNNTWSNRYIVGTGWGSAAAIETNITSHAQSPQIAIDANGNALAVWYQWRDSTGASDIWANAFK